MTQRPAVLIMQRHLAPLTGFLESTYDVYRFWEHPPVEAERDIQALVVAGEFPLDTALIEKLMRSHEVVVTVEEGAIGGLGAHVLTFASDEGLTDAGLKVRTMRLPDIFQDQDDPDKQYDEAGLNAPHIVDTVLNALRHNSAGVEEARA